MTPTAPPPNSPVPTSLSEVPAAAGAVLDDFFDATLPVAGAISPAVGQAADIVADFVRLGGKRVRPTFAFAGWLCAMSNPHRVPPHPQLQPSDALRVCAALELVQACALIHDDIIDHSDTRRGRPTVHRTFERRHRDAGWSGDGAHYGISAAILAGDLALAWADDLFGGHSPAGPEAGWRPPPMPAEVHAVWAAMRTEVLGGQYLDIVNEVSGDESIESAYRVMEFKTAAYTVARPLELGARLAGAPAELITDLRGVGHDLGIAFQLRDDMLGVFGDPDRTGKPSGDDLAEGKRTALLALALDLADDRDPTSARYLREALGRELDEAELTRVRDLLIEVGAAAEIERRIDQLLDAAVARLQTAQIGDGIRADLVAMAGRIAHREA